MAYSYVGGGVGFAAVAAEAIAAGEAVALHTDGTAKLANAITGATQQVPCVGLAECDAAQGDCVEIKGTGAKFVLAGGGLTDGGHIWLGEADGTVTQTKPSTQNDAMQCLGSAISDDTILLNIQEYTLHA